jgi:hypothetical protein
MQVTVRKVGVAKASSSRLRGYQAARLQSVSSGVSSTDELASLNCMGQTVMGR